MIRLQSFGSRAMRVGTFFVIACFVAVGCGNCDERSDVGLAITSPTAGATLSSADDLDSVSAGVQTNVVVDVVGLEEGEVVRVYSDATTVEIDPNAATPYEAIVGSAPSVTLLVTLSNGPHRLVACARAACSVKSAIVDVTVSAPDAPTVTITAPIDGFALTPSNEASNDCAAGTAGLDLQVTATTTATNGSAATIQVGSGAAIAATVTGGMVSGCAAAGDGFGTLDVVVTVTDADASDGTIGTGTGRVMLTRALPAGSPIAPIATVYGDHASRREGKASLRFAAVTDAMDAILASYEVRCAFAPIVTQGDWNMATVVPNTVTPVAAGTQTIPLQFKPGLYRHCLVRGTSAGGTSTPLPATDASAVVNAGFEVVALSKGTATDLGYSNATAVGDVNGDGFRDFVQTGQGSAALYFGSADFANKEPGVVFQSDDATTYFGTFATGLGDFNGDGRPDFAIGNPFYGIDAGPYGDGIVYVFYGRASDDAWPTTIDANVGPTCPADLCFLGATGSGSGLGIGLLGIGNFDGDAAGLGDLAVGAPGLNQSLVVLGSASQPARGTSIVFDGSASEPRGFRLQGAPSVSNGVDFGYGSVPLGDLDEDGLPELGVYRPGYDTNLGHAPNLRSELFRVEGRAHSGGSMVTLDATTDATKALSDAQWNDARCVWDGTVNFAVSDFDGDGRPDIACTSGDRMSATILYGAADGTFALSDVTTVKASTAAAGDYFGFFGGIAVHPVFGNVGDVDADGRQDLLLGNYESGPFTALRGAAVVYGRASRPTTIDPLTDSEFGLTVPTPLPPVGPTFYPRRVAYVGDLNGDGRPDVVVSDAEGAVFVLF